MKKPITLLSLFLALFLFYSKGYAKQSNAPQDKGVLLIISSYNPDTKRISAFMSEFEKAIVSEGTQYEVLLEDLSCRSILDKDEWGFRMKKILHENINSRLKAIILLGQEAWATFASLDNKEINVPVLVCYGSKNGIDLNLPIKSSAWFPGQVNLIEKIQKENNFPLGGIVCHYDIQKNIETILSFYPDTKCIALVTDNTYGGISLQAKALKLFSEIPNIELQLIDSRATSTQEAIYKISRLPKHSVLLIGTWRVDRDGLYYLDSSVNTLTKGNPDIPVFSLTGTGIGAIALGGYIPTYDYDPKSIYDQITNYYTRGEKIEIEVLDGQYLFNKELLEARGIEQYLLPKGSIVTSSLDEDVRKYKRLVFGSVIVIILLLFLVWFSLYSNIKNIKLKKRLIVQNEELGRAKLQAEESDRLKSSFLANMSHEIRTPLNSIAGFSQLICETDVDDDSKKEYRDIISKNVESLLKLINDILDISRLESGRINFNINSYNAIDICKKAMQTIVPLHKEGIEYIFEPKITEIRIECDEIRLLQILVNFLTNAGKFTKSGFIKLEVSENIDRGVVLFSVTDTGCGISPDKRKKIFDRFEKIDEFQQGFGLGLAISQQIATKMGGIIFLDESYNNGTRIILEHPNLQSDNKIVSGGGVNYYHKYTS